MRRAMVLSVLAAAAVLTAACGSEQDKMERGLVVDREVAVPESDDELEMTESERQAAENDEEAKREAERFDASQQ